VHDVDPGVDEYSPAGQSVHDIAPGAAEYWPAGQA